MQLISITLGDPLRLIGYRISEFADSGKGFERRVYYDRA
jgi:hypothetical protein